MVELVFSDRVWLLEKKLNEDRKILNVAPLVSSYEIMNA